MKPVVVGVTCGDPAGIGPQISLAAAKKFQDKYILLLIGSRDLPNFHELKVINTRKISKITTPGVYLLDVDIDVDGIELGNISANSGAAAMHYLLKATQLITDGAIDALCTAPVSKEAINQAGYKFVGHTEFFAQQFGATDYVMMFVTSKLKVSLVTTHIPLCRLKENLTVEKIITTAKLTYNALVNYFGIKSPRIGVCALNPHAGEGKIFGDEEERIILPAIKSANISMLSGPYPADTLFLRAIAGEFDCVIAHYHDQAMIPIKLVSFMEAVNLTLGLPFIRTSPAHGCAFNKARQGTASQEGMYAAIDLAAKLASYNKIH